MSIDRLINVLKNFNETIKGNKMRTKLIIVELTIGGKSIAHPSIMTTDALAIVYDRCICINRYHTGFRLILYVNGWRLSSGSIIPGTSDRRRFVIIINYVTGVRHENAK